MEDREIFGRSQRRAACARSCISCVMHEQAAKHAPPCQSCMGSPLAAPGRRRRRRLRRPHRSIPFHAQACLFPWRAGELELDHCSRRPRHRTTSCCCAVCFPAAVGADHGVETCLLRTKVNGRCCMCDRAELR